MDIFGVFIYLITLYLRPQDWMPFLYNLPVDYFIFSFILIACVIRGSLKLDFKNPIYVVFALWVLWIYFSGILNGKYDTAFQYGWDYLRRFIVFICFISAINKPERFKRVILLIILLSAIIGVQCIYQKIHGVGWAGQPLKQAALDESVGGFGLPGRANWVGLWDGMNVLCLLFVIAFSFSLQYLGKLYTIPLRLFAFVSVFFILFGVYLTKSRGGTMAILAVIMFNVMAIIKRKGAAIILAALIFLSFIVIAPSRLTTIDDKYKSTEKRVEMWEEAFDMIKYKPIAGIGRGEFKHYTHVLIAHNSFLELMGETGIIGLFLWISLIYLNLKTLWLINKNVTLSPKELLLMRTIAITILGYLIGSVFVTAEFEIFYILIALATSLGYVYNIKIKFSKQDFKNILLLQFGGMAFFFIFLRIWWRLY